MAVDDTQAASRVATAPMDRWFVLYSKPRMEREARDRLSAKGLGVFLPMLPRHDSALRSASSSRTGPALFPRYLFVKLDRERVSLDEIQWIPGLIGFVKFDGEPASVDDAVIQHIQLRLRELEEQVHAPFHAGQRLRLATGHPLAPLDVIFEKPCSDRKRAFALIDMLGRLTRCQIEIQYLGPIDAAV
jgi:transcriptional antiterminator RfaH